MIKSRKFVGPVSISMGKGKEVNFMIILSDLYISFMIFFFQTLVIMINTACKKYVVASAISDNIVTV